MADQSPRGFGAQGRALTETRRRGRVQGGPAAADLAPADRKAAAGRGQGGGGGRRLHDPPTPHPPGTPERAPARAGAPARRPRGTPLAQNCASAGVSAAQAQRAARPVQNCLCWLPRISTPASAACCVPLVALLPANRGRRACRLQGPAERRCGSRGVRYSGTAFWLGRCQALLAPLHCAARFPASTPPRHRRFPASTPPRHRRCGVGGSVQHGSGLAGLIAWARCETAVIWLVEGGRCAAQPGCPSWHAGSLPFADRRFRLCADRGPNSSRRSSHFWPRGDPLGLSAAHGHRGVCAGLLPLPPPPPPPPRPPPACCSTGLSHAPHHPPTPPTAHAVLHSKVFVLSQVGSSPTTTPLPPLGAGRRRRRRACCCQPATSTCCLPHTSHD